MRQPHTSGYNNPYARNEKGETSYYGKPLSSSLSSTKTPFLDLLAVARQMKIPVTHRVEASRSDGAGYLELSDEHGRLLCEYAEALGYYVERV